MADVLSKIPLVGWGPIITIAAIAVSCLIIAVLLWRNHKVWRWVFVSAVPRVRRRRCRATTSTRRSPTSTTPPTCWASRPTRRSTATPVVPTSSSSPTAPSPRSPCPTPRASSVSFDAQVLAARRSTSATRAQHFPVVYLLHGNPGQPTDWLTAAGGATTGLTVAQSGQAGHPRHARGPPEQLHRATASASTAQSQGNAETYITKDVIAAIDTHLRTTTNAKGRAIGGMSMGGFCGLNLGPQAPRPVLGGPRLLRGDRV